jgi:hypothetical protein
LSLGVTSLMFIFVVVALHSDDVWKRRPKQYSIVESINSGCGAFEMGL